MLEAKRRRPTSLVGHLNILTCMRYLNKRTWTEFVAIVSGYDNYPVSEERCARAILQEFHLQFYLGSSYDASSTLYIQERLKTQDRRALVKAQV